MIENEKKQDRIGVKLDDLRLLIEGEARKSGNSLSQEIRLLIQEAIKARYQKRSLAQIIEYADIWELAKQTEIPLDRLAALACESESPTFSELVVMANALPLDAKELAQLSTLKPKVKHTEEKKKQNECKYVSPR